MSTQPQLSPLEQLMQQPAQQAASPSQSDLSPLEQLMQMKPQEDKGATPEEQAFLKANPDHQWVSADPSKPNTQPGIYHKSAVADMAKDPTMEHHPVDLHFAKHTAEAAGESALATGGALGAGLVDPVVGAVTSHLTKVKAILDAAGRLGLTGEGINLGIKEARELYKEFSKESK